jgi:hypothetical protein
LPLVVHLILDEHIGIDGLPPESTVPGLQADLRSFYHSLGFRTFDSAYSEHQDTELSIGHLVNFSPGVYRPDLIRSYAPGFEHSLTQNAYFSRVIERGYQVRAYQTSFLQVCPEGIRAICETRPLGIAILQDQSLSVAEKVRLIAGTFLFKSALYGKAIDWYDVLRGQSVRAGIRLPRRVWFWRTAPLSGMSEIRRVASDLSGATRGELYFAHFMLPHWPFVYDEDCKLVPFDGWKRDGRPLASPPERRDAYIHYGRQLRCTSRMIRQLMESIPSNLRADAIVIVQGDHGSRLSLSHAKLPNSRGLETDNERDTYSTLFAVRAPGLSAVSDHAFVPITCLLRSLVDGEFRSMPGLENCVPAPVVFVYGKVRPLAPFVRAPN